MQSIKQESYTISDANQELEVDLTPNMWSFIVRMINYPELSFDAKKAPLKLMVTCRLKSWLRSGLLILVMVRVMLENVRSARRTLILIARMEFLGTLKRLRNLFVIPVRKV